LGKEGYGFGRVGKELQKDDPFIKMPYGSLGQGKSAGGREKLHKKKRKSIRVDSERKRRSNAQRKRPSPWKKKKP